MSLAEDAFRFAAVFEGELLTHLMLVHWGHPLADDAEFRSELLETATEVLQASIDGEKLIEPVPPESMNLVAAIWYAEWCNTDSERSQNLEKLDERRTWLKNVRHALPSCFCNPELLE